MSAKHTPGPWWADVGDEEADRAYQWPVIMSSTREIVGTEGFYGDIEEDIANAILAAAAPELLEALKSLVHSLDESDLIHDDQRQAFAASKAAIAKATGQS